MSDNLMHVRGQAGRMSIRPSDTPSGGMIRAAARAALVGVLLLPAPALALPFTARVGSLSGTGAIDTVAFPDVAEAGYTQAIGNLGAQLTVYARSGPLSLGVLGEDRFTGGGAEAEATINIGDLVFSSLNANATHALIGFGGLLDGEVTFGGVGDVKGSLIASVRLSGAPVSGGSSSAGYNASFAKDRDPVTLQFLPTPPAVVNQFVGGAVVVELNKPVSFMASLFLRGGGSGAFAPFGPGIFAGDFSNSLSFDPNRFFDLPDGITANSPSLGLVSNRLPAYATIPGVPEPGSMALLLAGAALHGVWRRSRGQCGDRRAATREECPGHRAGASVHPAGGTGS